MKRIALTALIIGLVTVTSLPKTAYAEEVRTGGTDTALAGIGLLMNDYYNSIETEQAGEIVVDGAALRKVHRVPSPYDNLGIANVRNYVNIRSGPSTDYKIIGKLYKGCVANILGWEGDWVKIQSGNIEEGYIKACYLLIGWDADERIEEFCERIATVTCPVLNVRTGPGTEYKRIEQISKGSSFYVQTEYEDWVEIVLGQDDVTGKNNTGFVSKDYVTIEYEYQYAITIEEEKAKIAAEEAAKKAEEERLRKLAEEEAARKAAEAAAKKAREEAEAAAKAAAAQAEAKKAEAEAALAKQLQKEQEELATAAAKLRQDVVSYAIQFIGNKYVWGGTSLTKGADCSGFVQSIYKQFGYTIPRVSRDQAKSAGYMDVIPDLDHLLPGDLIFYTNGSGVVDHVSMYIGNGKIIHAASVKVGITTSVYNMRLPYKARRVIQ